MADDYNKYLSWAWHDDGPRLDRVPGDKSRRGTLLHLGPPCTLDIDVYELPETGR